MSSSTGRVTVVSNFVPSNSRVLSLLPISRMHCSRASSRTFSPKVHKAPSPLQLRLQMLFFENAKSSSFGYVKLSKLQQTLWALLRTCKTLPGCTSAPPTCCGCLEKTACLWAQVQTVQTSNHPKASHNERQSSKKMIQRLE